MSCNGAAMWNCNHYRCTVLSQGKSLKPLKIERDLRKMLPQNDRKIEELRKIEGLLAYAVEHNDEAEFRRLKALLDKVADGD